MGNPGLGMGNPPLDMHLSCGGRVVLEKVKSVILFFSMLCLVAQKKEKKKKKKKGGMFNKNKTFMTYPILKWEC